MLLAPAGRVSAAEPKEPSPSTETAAASSSQDIEAARAYLQKLYAEAAQRSAEADAESDDPDEASARQEIRKGFRGGELKIGQSIEADAVRPEADEAISAPAGAMSLRSLPVAEESGVTGKTISVPKGEATLEGMGESFSAQLSTGIATYTVPFSIPRARGGAQASLGLSYSSASGQSVVGMGWSLGVPFIARQTDHGIPKYDDQADFHHDQDRFVFNGGQELVPVCRVSGGSCGTNPYAMPVWADGYQLFEARVEGAFMRFFWSPDHRTWRVQSKSGETMEFGVPLDGTNEEAGLEQNPEVAGTLGRQIFRWLLVRHYDSYGNANPASGPVTPSNVVRYRYESDTSAGGVAHLTDIYHTSPSMDLGGAPLTTYAHHVHLVYESREDVMHSYRSGWRMEQNRRLVRVDLASKSLSGWFSGPRELLRRYHLGYDPAFHSSFLTSVTVEGRCSSPVLETSELLPSITPCPRLPAMTFEYQHTEGRLGNGTLAGAPLDGYEAFDEQLKSLGGSPDYSLDQTDTTLHDVNSDGLPDVLVTAPGYFGGKHGVFFNSTSGVADQFVAGTIGVDGALGANENDITLGNLNVVPLDIDGDATVNLVHMPLVKRYAVYTPEKVGTAWWWKGRAVTTADSLNPKIDFGKDAAFIKVLDADFDGLVDVVRTTGTELQTFFALGRYPGGDGRFGTAKRTGIATSQIGTDPVRKCLPWSGTSVSFGDQDTQIADMNGDGIVDIIRLRRGAIQYWPGRGNGFWGTGNPYDCAGGSFGQNRHVVMDASPYYSDITGDSLRLEDVNGDGLTDLVQVRFQDVDIWLNVDGGAWTQKHTIPGTPASPSYAHRVRLTDINGSGTPDILWGDASRYRYIDLAGGKRPGTLSRVKNGLGKVTELTYRSSTAEMIAATQANKPWSKGMPIVAQVVKSVAVTDGIDTFGAPARDVTQYTYTEPVYDGRQREFRGFRQASSRRVGDANSPAESTDTSFLLGECADETPTNGVDDCALSEMWRDNPREALKGIPYLTERRSDAGVYHSTVDTTSRLRHVATGLDGRAVRHAFASATWTTLYNTDGFVPSNSALYKFVVEIEKDGTTSAAESRSIPKRTSFLTRATLRDETVVDAVGNTTLVTSYGCEGTGACSGLPNELLQKHTGWSLRPDAPGHWLWAVEWTSLNGDASKHLSGLLYELFTLDVHGKPLDRRVNQSGIALTRNVSDSGYPSDAAPLDGGLYYDTWLAYDEVGNRVREQGKNRRCRDIAFEPGYLGLPIQETQYSGGCGEGGSTEPGSGTPLQTTVGYYDLGLGAATDVYEPNGTFIHVNYDEFGRVREIYKPNPDDYPNLCWEPAVTMQYELPNAEHPNWSLVWSWTEDGPWCGSGSTRAAVAIIDGLGRTVGSIVEGELGFIVTGLQRFDAKGAISEKHMDQVFLGASSQCPTPITQTYDAFGRPRITRDHAGYVTADRRYHAISVDTYDAEDLPGGSHPNTYMTEVHDGHGRLVRTIEIGNGTERVTTVRYFPTGVPEVIERSSGGQTVSRFSCYDHRGRLLCTMDPNIGAGYALPTAPNLSTPGAPPAGMTGFRYRYDESGDLVGTSDARGQGANYFYDGLARATAVDLFPDGSDPLNPYTVPTFTGGTPTSGVEVSYEYDGLSSAPTPPGWTSGPSLGRLVRIRDQATHTLFRYDARGRVVETAVQLAKPGVTAENVLADRYAPRWYRQTQTYDMAGRPVTQSTGASVPELLGTGGQSTVTTVYNKRGLVQSAHSSYDTGSAGGGSSLISSTTHKPHGPLEQIVYGDAKQTTTNYETNCRLETKGVDTFRSSATFGVLESTDFDYDLVSNPIHIYDNRTAAEWPDGAKPAFRTFGYDDFYRVTSVTYAYQGTPSGAADKWISPFDKEDTESASQIDPRLGHPMPHVMFGDQNGGKRVTTQTFAYDWMGNITSSGDDLNGFFDRSLGAITHNPLNSGPYQLKEAEIATGSRSGKLTASYDASGNLTQLYLDRDGPCQPISKCAQAFSYDWDELGRLKRARRWDLPSINFANLPSLGGTPAIEIHYRYDADDNRVLKRVHEDGNSDDVHTAYIFDTLDLRRTYFDTQVGDYVQSANTEVPYLVANGVRLARVVYKPTIPASDPQAQHVFLELGDHLGSTTTVLDKRTGDLVEHATYSPYGATESDFRPDGEPGQEDWDAFREDYRFTGKEEDVEVGLVYFGKRFLSPALNRWMSPDPLAVHDVGKADLNLYGYVKGMALKATDPLGLCGDLDACIQGDFSTSNIPQVAALGDTRTPAATPSTSSPAEPNGMDSVRANTPSMRASPALGARSAVATVVGGGAALALGAGAAIAAPVVAGAVSEATAAFAVANPGTTTAIMSTVGALSETPYVPLAGGLGVAGVHVGGEAAPEIVSAMRAEGLSLRYGPHEVGPLSESVTSTFRGGSYTATTLSEPLTLYRGYGGSAGPLGSYWTRSAPSGPLQLQLDSALVPSWGNTVTGVSSIRAPAGTTIFEGFAAPQSTGVGQIMGGGSQVYIPRVDPTWLVSK